MNEMMDIEALLEVVRGVVAIDCHVISKSIPTVYVTTQVTYSNGDSVGVYVIAKPDGRFSVSDEADAARTADLAGRLSHFHQVSPHMCKIFGLELTPEREIDANNLTAHQLSAAISHVAMASAMSVYAALGCFEEMETEQEQGQEVRRWGRGE